jgi:Cu/Ag efflux protein CusF
MIKAVIRSALVVALAGAVLGFAQTAQAGDKEKKADKAKPQQATGDITAVDAAAGTITIEHKKTSVTFTAAPDIKFGAEGENLNLTLANLKVGDHVTVHYTQEGDKKIAHKIGRVDIGAKKAAKDDKKADK